MKQIGLGVMGPFRSYWVSMHFMHVNYTCLKYVQFLYGLFGIWVHNGKGVNNDLLSFTGIGPLFLLVYILFKEEGVREAPFIWYHEVSEMIS